jgi:ketosteroid isomerase-like protein
MSDDRNIVEIVVSTEEDGAFAVMDIDSMWRDTETNQEIRWKGRVCKFYTRMADGEWKVIFQTESFDYGSSEQNPTNAIPDSKPTAKTSGLLLP